MNELQTEKDGFVARQEAAVAEANNAADTAHAAATREMQRRIAVEEEIVQMRQAVADARKVADTASFECKRLHNAVLAVSQVRAAVLARRLQPMGRKRDLDRHLLF